MAWPTLSVKLRPAPALCFKEQKGFSLIELLIVVAIILIIAAIAIPTGVIRYSLTGVAPTAASSPLQ